MWGTVDVKEPRSQCSHRAIAVPSQCWTCGREWNRLDSEALAAAEPPHWVMLDATLPPDALAKQVWEVVRERLPAR